MKKSKKQLVAAAAAGLMVLSMGAYGSIAYLTDNEAATNTFTVGKVQIDLTEPNYPGNDDDEPKDLVPNQEVAKDPMVTNTGVNDAIVFATVTVPVKNVTVVADDGTRGTKSPTELFWFKDADDTAGTHVNHFNTNDWMELAAKETYGTADGSATTYVFVYKTALAADAKTSPLFDKVQLKNIMENEVTAGEDQKVHVRAYAIQAAEILENDIDLTEGLTEGNLNKIYDIFLNQQGTDFDSSLKDAASSNKLNLVGGEN